MSESTKTYGQYMADYKRRTTKRYVLDLNRDKHADVIAHLDSLGRGSVSFYVLSLIREDMAKFAQISEGEEEPR